MSITAVALTSGMSPTDATSYATASISPTANRLVCAIVAARCATTQSSPTASGGGMTAWAQAVTRQDAGAALVITLFRALQVSPGSGAVTFDFGAVTQSWCLWSIFEIDGIDTGGSNGSAAIIQTGANEVASDTTVAITLAAFGDAANGTIGAFYASDPQLPDVNFVVGSGYTKIACLRETADSDSGILSEWRADNDTLVDASFHLSQAIGIAAEIKVAVAGGGGQALDSDYLLHLTVQR